VGYNRNTIRLDGLHIQAVNFYFVVSVGENIPLIRLETTVEFNLNIGLSLLGLNSNIFSEE
jgi:hypothetical protein